jgi:hypothetical protein
MVLVLWKGAPFHIVGSHSTVESVEPGRWNVILFGGNGFYQGLFQQINYLSYREKKVLKKLHSIGQKNG